VQLGARPPPHGRLVVVGRMLVPPNASAHAHSTAPSQCHAHIGGGVAGVAAVADVAAVACGSDNIDDVQLHWQWLADDTCCFFSAGRKGTHIKLVCGQHPVKSLSLCVNTPYGVHGGCSCAIVGGCRWFLGSKQKDIQRQTQIEAPTKG